MIDMSLFLGKGSRKKLTPTPLDAFLKIKIQRVGGTETIIDKVIIESWFATWKTFKDCYDIVN